MRLPAQAVRPARDGARREGAQHDAEENTGRGEHRQEGAQVQPYFRILCTRLDPKSWPRAMYPIERHMRLSI